MHLRQEHSEDISIDQLALLVEKSAHPAADPLEKLFRYHKVGAEDRSVCPLCPFAIASTRIPEPHSLMPDGLTSADYAKSMRDYIVEHLESIALLSLPEQEVDNAASNKVQSESARISSRGEGQDLEPLPHLTSEEWDTYNRVMARSGLGSLENVQNFIPSSGYEDWTFIASADAEAMCNKLDLPTDVAFLVGQIFGFARNEGFVAGESELLLIAGCIFIACRHCKFACTLQEIFQTSGMSKPAITENLTKLEGFFERWDTFRLGDRGHDSALPAFVERLRLEVSTFDPGRDPVLLPFVERARRIQTAQTQKQPGIPLLVISDPGGLEIPEAQWADNPEQL
ncbi:MAG: hypothetical protein Q9226_000980 [Calogaya cf. arnoldii]